MPTLDESRKQLQDNIRSFIVDGQSKEEFIRDTASDAIEGNIARETLSELGEDGPATGEVIIEEIEEQTNDSLSKIEEQTDSSSPSSSSGSPSNSQPQPDPQPDPQPQPSNPSQPLQTVSSPQSGSSSSSGSSSNSGGGVVNRSKSGEAPNVVENPAKDNGTVDMGITTVSNNNSDNSSSSMIDSIDPKIIAGVAALVVFLMR